MNIQLAIGAVFTTLLLVAGHWFPWWAFCGNDGLPRLMRYCYGVTSILLGFTVWQWGNWELVGGLFLLCVAGGAATGLAYVLDDYARARTQARRGKDMLDAGK